MTAFLESICLINGKVPLLDLHQKRVQRTFDQFFPDSTPPQLIKLVPDRISEHKHKIRVTYNGSQTNVEIEAYIQRALESVKMIQASDGLDYSYKSEDRSALQNLFDQKGNADEIVIVKNDLVTDSFFANLAFWDGSDWYTPDTFLLNGVRRQHLLSMGQIKEMRIVKSMIKSFEKVSLINAMLDLGESVTLTDKIT